MRAVSSILGPQGMIYLLRGVAYAFTNESSLDRLSWFLFAMRRLPWKNSVASLDECLVRLGLGALLTPGRRDDVRPLGVNSEGVGEASVARCHLSQGI